MEELLLQDVEDAVTHAYDSIDASAEPDRGQRIRALSWVLSPANIVYARSGGDHLLITHTGGLNRLRQQRRCRRW